MTLATIVEIELRHIDAERVERALELTVLPHKDRGRYRVVGGREEHWVDLITPNHPRCDCGDHEYREAVCKHILAALYYEGHEPTLLAVANLVGSLRAQLDAAAALLKRRRRAEKFAAIRNTTRTATPED